MNYAYHILVMLGIYFILSQGLNIVMGYTGLLSICNAAFYGIGAYASTLLIMKSGINFFVAMPFSIAVSVILSFIVSIPSLRLKGDYFVLATMGFQSIIFSVLYNWVDFTRGPYGIPGIPSPSLFGFKFDSSGSFLILSTFFAGAVIIFSRLITASQFGRCLKSVREDELAAKSLGKNTVSLKITAFAISAGISAVAGSLYASYVTYIDPTSFTIAESLFLVVILAMGGSGNIKGPVVGTLLMVIIPELLRFLRIPDTIAANVRVMIYALILIILMRFRQKGLAGEYEFD